ncbi:MAG: TadE/TadG family type IV pilus assembly protein [Terracidiphilus sp.]|jgi:Flp pilus assembly protein TadG
MKKVNDLRGQAAVFRSAGADSLSLCGRLRTWLHSRERGQAIVEFAFVIPILLLVLLAIFELGIFLLNYQTLTQAVNQGGVRIQQLSGLPVSSGGTSDPCADIATAVIGSAGNLGTTGNNGIQLTLTVGSNTPAGPSPAASFSCGNLASAVQAGGGGTSIPVIVTGTYPCMALTYGFNFAANGCQMKVTVQELMQ